MLVRQLLETSLIPPNARSYLLGKAVAATTNDVQEKYNSMRLVMVHNTNGSVEALFEMYAGSHVGVASLFKKRLKEARIASYSRFDKENYGLEHAYTFIFADFPWEDFRAVNFRKGWNEVIEDADLATHLHLPDSNGE